MIHHLSTKGAAGFALASGSASSTSSGEGEIRRNIVEADLVDCMAALPGQLFYSTQVPACLWFLSRRRGGKRRGKVLLIDARGMGRMEDRTHRVLDGEDIRKIANTYHAWQDGKEYRDVPGFCKSAGTEEIRGHGHILAPDRYAGAAPQGDNGGEPFEQRTGRPAAGWAKRQAESRRLDAVIQKNLKSLGFVTQGGIN